MPYYLETQISGSNMKILIPFLGLLLLVHAHEEYCLSPDYKIDALNRSSFPPGFIFGASSSAFQIEGGWDADGKGESNWDYFTHKYPEKIKERGNGEMACNSYHRYKEDVELLKNMNADAYRFSISWARVLPRGKLSGGVNEKGIQYYNNLIDELIANGLQPTVTLFHWDIPQALEDDYGGFLSEDIVKDFHDYSNLCFKKFGDRVKFWITLNEPLPYSYQGYDSGNFAPGRCSDWKDNSCPAGDSGTEPYIVAHNLLLAHAHAVQLYRTKYQKQQKGKIGITLAATGSQPLTNSTLDYHASIRFLDFTFGWFMNPIVYGDYPSIMLEIAGERIPEFSANQSQLLKGSFDFLGFNYYTAMYIGHRDTSANSNHVFSYGMDMHVYSSYTDPDGNLIGEQLGCDWLYVYPEGIWKFLIYIKQKYKNPIIYITENGANEVDNPKLSLEDALIDNHRIRYYFEHLSYVRKAIENGVRIKGFYGWSILDNFEWSDGYTVRFGINYVDYKTFQRYPKLSAKWFKRFLQK